jgi:hypothetical protein
VLLQQEEDQELSDDAIKEKLLEISESQKKALQTSVFSSVEADTLKRKMPSPEAASKEGAIKRLKSMSLLKFL